MDLHKALNRLAAAHAEETLAGAHVSGLLPEDRPAVEAFMRGVARDRRSSNSVIPDWRRPRRAAASG